MLGMTDKKDDVKKEEPKKEETKKPAVHLRTEEGETHHDLLPNNPQEIVTDPKTRKETVEQGVTTKVEIKE